MPQFLLSLLLLGLPALVGAIENQMQGHPSPYLAMHGQDPVHWQLWGPQPLARAQEQDRLVYISIGYFSCHWCHVMQRESYSDPQIAKILNEHFVPVKVDRELNPALDARLIDFVERTRGYSGWPLNVFITPEGHPLVGFVYLPPEEFQALLRNVYQRWEVDATSLRSMAVQATEALGTGEKSRGPELEAGMGRRLEDRLVDRAMEMGDEIEGGFSEPNKFPMVPQMSALLAAYERKPREPLGRFLNLTLERMASQGLRDQVRGGFFRYVVDPNWKVPHFEKMLYDNALLAELYLQAARVFDKPAYETIARDTLDFMLRELRSPAGGFIASLSAVDDQGIEGGFYLWRESQLKKILSDKELSVVRTFWGMQGPAPLDAGHLPLQAMAPEQAADRLELTGDELAERLQAIREKLMHVQEARSLPRDTKVLAAWNGLALRALSRAARLDNSRAYRDAARGVRNYLVNRLWTGDRLLRARSSDGDFGSAALEDYAYVADGLAEWAALVGSKSDRQLARRILEQAWQRFHTERGWRLSERLLIQYGAIEAVIADDGPLPSPSAVTVATSIEFARAEGDERLARKARSALNVAHDVLVDEPFWYASQIRAIADVQTASER